MFVLKFSKIAQVRPSLKLKAKSVIYGKMYKYRQYRPKLRKTR